MDREQAKALWPIIKAYAEGKQIEIKPKVKGSYWDILEEDDMQYIDFKKCDLRIKPEPKYRPFKDADECFEEMKKHQPYGWVKDTSKMYNITIIRDDGIIVNTNIDGGLYSFKSAFSLKFVDGTPFGIKEE